MYPALRPSLEKLVTLTCKNLEVMYHHKCKLDKETSFEMPK